MTGLQNYREYLLASISTRYRIHLFTLTPTTWEDPYLVGSTVVAATDTATLAVAAAELNAREPVSGVICWDESRVHQAACVAESLGLPHTPAEAVWRCRDKYQGRSALALAGLAQPDFALAGTVEEALAAAENIGYPVVVKPRAAAASYGVSLVRSAEKMAESFAFADQATVAHMPEFDQSVLVEEYLPGPEVSVDSVVVGGRVTPLFVGRKQTGYAPYFEETGHVVANRDPLLRDPTFLTLLQDTHTALGFTHGWTHAELKLDPIPKVIEVNARLGGDMIPYLGMAATGIDPGLAIAALASGAEPTLEVRRDLVAAIRFFYPEHDDTVIDSVTFDAAALPAEIDRAVVVVMPGDTVSPPPRGLLMGRIAYATAVAPTGQECMAALDQAAKALQIRERTAPR